MNWCSTSGVHLHFVQIMEVCMGKKKKKISITSAFIESDCMPAGFIWEGPLLPENLKSINLCSTGFFLQFVCLLFNIRLLVPMAISKFFV